MKTKEALLIDVLKKPNLAEGFTLAQWDLLIRQARVSRLLAYLEHLLIQSLDSEVPLQVGSHLFSNRVVSEKQHLIVHWEVEKIRKALAVLNIPVILLKGAAYVVSELPNSYGRLFSDIDLLVGKDNLNSSEHLLMLKGWLSSHQDDYDQHYYREWMHEIPPLKHAKRGSVLDVHHTILPPTAKYKPDPAKILADIREISPGVYTLSPVDMVIHSATHLFHEGDFDHGLRDILDLHGLLNFFGENETGFWDALVPRAIELDLINPLYYALHYCSLILGTEIPPTVLQQVKAGEPNPLMSRVMDWLFMRALRPDHPSCDLPFTGLARWVLYVRSHYLRMPLYLLIPHLARKAWKRRVVDKSDVDIPMDIPEVETTKIKWCFWAR